MAQRRRFVFAFASLFACLGITSIASAQGPTSIDQPAPVEYKAPEPKTMTLVANPLSTIVGRYGVDFTYMVAPHHGLVVNPYYSHVSPQVTTTENGVSTTYSETFSGFGGELGYRYYTGEKGANGFFIGPSLLFGAFSQSNSYNSDKTSFTSMGAAVDIGGQAIIGDGFTIGGGFGLQYTKTSTTFNDLPLTSAILAGGGVRPRFLFTIGYSFG